MKTYNAEKHIAETSLRMHLESPYEELDFNPDEFIDEIENKNKTVIKMA